MFYHVDTIPQATLKTIQTPKGRFYITPDGNQYPSVTTVLGAGTKEWRENWRTSLGPEKADKEAKRAADRGTSVHTMIEKFLNNDPAPTQEQELSHILEFNTLRLHLKQINNIRSQETVVWSDTMRIAGRLDCVGEYKNVLSIIDFKTSTNTKRLDMIEDYWLQTTAYALMLQERYDVYIEQAVIMISVERGATPMIFTRPIDQYISPLLKRINTYHNSQGT